MSALSSSVLWPLLLNFQPLFTSPSFATFVQLATGALVNTGRQTVCNMIRTLPVIPKHFTAYHRFFRTARWSLFRAGQVLAWLILDALPEEQPVRLVVDDTTFRRKGSHVYAGASHRDAVRSSRKHPAWCRGHKWLVISILLPLPGITRPWALPVLVLLVPPKTHPKYRKPVDLTITGMRLLLRWCPRRSFVLTGDYAFAAHRMARFIHSQPRAALVSRFHPDAALFQPPTPRKGPGRPRIKGERLPTPAQCAGQPNAPWVETVLPWYGGRTVTVQLLTGTGCWYHSGQGIVPVRWVVVRRHGARDECFYTTEPAMPPADIVRHYIDRWAIEVTFEETRRHLHIEHTEVWTQRPVQRLVPCLFALFSLTVLAVQKHLQDHSLPSTTPFPWYNKPEPTYADVIAHLRVQQLEQLYFSLPHQKQRLPKNIRDRFKPILRLASHAA